MPVTIIAFSDIRLYRKHKMDRTLAFKGSYTEI